MLVALGAMTLAAGLFLFLWYRTVVGLPVRRQPLFIHSAGFKWGMLLAAAVVLVLGIVLLVLGLLLKISILWTIGIIVLVIGAVLFLLGSVGRPVAGRRHYW